MASTSRHWGLGLVSSFLLACAVLPAPGALTDPARAAPVAAIQAHLYALAIIGVLASVVGAYYYLRVIKVMWFDEAKDEFARTAGSLRLVFGLSGLFVIAYVFFGGAIGGAADLAAATLF